MAAVTIVPISNPFLLKQTLSATPNTQQELVIPGSARRVEITFRQHDGVLIYSGGTDGAVISTEATMSITKEKPYYWDLPQSPQSHSIWIASGTASVVVDVVVSE